MLTEFVRSKKVLDALQCRLQQSSAMHGRRLLSGYPSHYRRSTLRSVLPFDATKQLQHPSQIKSITARWHGDSSVPHDAPTVNVTFLQPDGTTRITVPARIGESLLETAHRNEIDLEGACEGVCACSTCHLIIPQKIYDALPEASENEEDMLDMAFGLTETSRLGCQIKVTSEMEGIVLEMPKATRNFYVDGHKPKPH
jgi:ferredoxin-2, mitochondrial